MRGSSVKAKTAAGIGGGKEGRARGGWREARGGRPRRTRASGWVGSRCGAMRRRPVAEKTATGTPPAGCGLGPARGTCLPSAQARRWVRIFPVCRLPVRFRTQTGARHRQVDDLPPLDEGDESGPGSQISTAPAPRRHGSSSIVCANGWVTQDCQARALPRPRPPARSPRRAPRWALR